MGFDLSDYTEDLLGKDYLGAAGDVYTEIVDFIGLGIEEDPNPYRKNIKNFRGAPDENLDVIYGSVRTAGIRVAEFVRGSENQYLYYVYAISHGKINKINFPRGKVGDVKRSLEDHDNIEFAYALGSYNQDLTAANGSTDGSEDNASSNMTTFISELADDEGISTRRVWDTVNQHFKGVAIAIVKIKGEKGTFETVPSDITFDVLGREVYDPRDQTTKYSYNPSLCILDYWTNDVYGKGLSYDDFNLETFKDAATLFESDYLRDTYNSVNIGYKRDSVTGVGVIQMRLSDFQNTNLVVGDSLEVEFTAGSVKGVMTSIEPYTIYSRTQQASLTLINIYFQELNDTSLTQYPFTISNFVASGGITLTLKQYIPRATCNGAVDTGKNIDDNLKQLVKSFNGFTSTSNGEIVIVPEIAVDPADYYPIIFNEDNITSDIQVELSNYDKRLNGIEARIVSAEENFDDVTHTVKSDVFLKRDSNRPKETTINLPFTNSRVIADNIMKVELNKSRHNGLIEFSVLWDGADLEAGDVIQVQHKNLSWGDEDTGDVRLLRVVGTGIPTIENDITLTAVPYDAADYNLGTLNYTQQREYINELEYVPVPLVSNLSVSSAMPDANYTLKVSWTEPTSDNAQSYYVEVLDSGSSVVKRQDNVQGDAVYLKVNLTLTNDYTVRVYSKDFAGRNSFKYVETSFTYTGLPSPVDIVFDAVGGVSSNQFTAIAVYATENSEQAKLQHKWYLAPYNGSTEPTYLDAVELVEAGVNSLVLNLEERTQPYRIWCRPVTEDMVGNVYPSGNGVSFVPQTVLSQGTPVAVQNFTATSQQITWDYSDVSGISEFLLKFEALSGQTMETTNATIRVIEGQTSYGVDTPFREDGTYKVTIRAIGKTNILGTTSTLTFSFSFSESSIGKVVKFGVNILPVMYSEANQSNPVVVSGSATSTEKSFSDYGTTLAYTVTDGSLVLGGDIENESAS